MLINIENEKTTNHVKFISYTGKYPTLCMGTLTLEIDGERVVFNDESPCFWISGGGCGFSDDYSDEYTNEGEWQIDVACIPDKYKKYAAEIDAVFNANVPHGCCGGCL